MMNSSNHYLVALQWGTMFLRQMGQRIRTQFHRVSVTLNPLFFQKCPKNANGMSLDAFYFCLEINFTPVRIMDTFKLISFGMYDSIKKNKNSPVHFF